MTDFPDYLKALRPQVEETLDRLLPGEEEAPTRLHQAMRYSIFAGGKRIRPALVVLAGETLGARREVLLPGSAAVEMIHTFSLIHDDLPALDNDDLRRGRPTLHRQFDEAMAILAGDALLTLGLTTLAEQPPDVSAKARRDAVAVVGDAVGSTGMIGGQVADLDAEESLPEDAGAVLEGIHRRKTGALLTASVRLGGVYSGASENEDKLLGRIGDGIGLMFQIADDILDVEGTSEALGKTVGKDAQAQKLTYPRVYGLDKSKAMLAETGDELRDVASNLPEGGKLFQSLISYLSTRDR